MVLHFILFTVTLKREQKTAHDAEVQHKMTEMKERQAYYC
ncbi:YrzI family protein [Ectobacillus sp. JY-23]|nr:YrzI family protein [Ectobacillus sp. JY-23]UOY92200.1 YrzI family protein [Ectobacillus sp. JY-23]